MGGNYNCYQAVTHNNTLKNEIKKQCFRRRLMQ
uniref:Uncharacterized protein n=1 Tax=Anguilla anguilla TaxID=7936 RepID=A0A0E9RV51_ANGAN